MTLPPHFIAKGYVDCPVCEGDGNFQDEECHFCECYGFLYLGSLEHDDTKRNGWDKLEYTTYYTYLRAEKKCYQQSTDSIVEEAGPSFGDMPGIPPETQYTTVERETPEGEKSNLTKV